VRIADQVGAAAGLIGVLLALITLFTSAQSAAFQAEQTRVGGANRTILARIAALSLALFVVTGASYLSLGPLALDVWRARGTPEWQAFFWIFLWVWVLLVFLAAWQVVVACLAARQWAKLR
jgi:uncharacterized BrkB/YihY/UPF0761 family membrane protein